MKRILVYGMTDNRGGIESYLMTYNRILSQTEKMIFDFVSEYKPIAYAEEIEKLGGQIYYIPSRREGLFKHMKAIRSIVKEQKQYDTVYFNVLSASEVFTVLSVAWLKGVKKIVHSHNNSVKSMGRHRLLRPLLTLLADEKLACAEEAAEFMFGTKAVKRNEVTVMSNAIDVEKYCYNRAIREEVRAALGLTPEQFVVGHVGRMCYQKNSLFLLEVFDRIYQKDNHAVLLYVGDGEDRPQVEEMIETYGIGNHVLLLGMRDDVHRLMQAMDVFVLPSRFEGLPIVLVEAQAAGLKCVCSNRFTDKSDVTGNVQFISLDEDADYWATEIVKNCTKERENMKRQLTNAGFNIEYEAEKLEKILKETNV